MASVVGSPSDGRRSPSPSKDGFLFKTNGIEDWDRIVKTTSSRPKSALGFEKFPDYSRINAERHNANRRDTFHTPASLNDKNFNVPVRISKRDLYDLCEQSFRRSVSNLSNDIVRDVKLQFQESLEALRKEGSDAVEAQQHRESTYTVMLKQIYEMLHDRHVDKDVLQKEIHSGEMFLLEGQRDLLLRLEGKFMQSFDQVRNELQDVRRAQEQAEDDLRAKLRSITNPERISIEDQEHLLQRTAEQITQVASMQKSLNAYCVQNSKEIQSLHESQTQQREEICSKFQAHFDKLGESAISGDSRQVLNQIKKYHLSASSENTQLLSEIGKIQQALNLDFAHIFEELEEISVRHAKMNRTSTMRSTTSDLDMETPKLRVRKRVREYWAQTDDVATTEVSCQTDDRGRMGKNQKRSGTYRKRMLSQPVSVKPKTALERIAEKKVVQPVFADAEAMRLKAQQALVKRQYNVLDEYHEYGCAQEIARSSFFEHVTLIMILLNTVWIAIDVDHNDADFLNDADPIFQVAENTFCLYFTIELLIRFFAFRRKRNCLRDFWFVFDLALVTLMIVETWILTLVHAIVDLEEGSAFGGASILRVARIGKMLRISRMARLFKVFPELVILLKGVGVASRSVSVFFVLWLIIIYIFAILFRQLTEGDAVGIQFFKSVPDAMNTLLLDGLLPDTSPLVHDLTQDKPFLWPIIIFFVLFASVTLMYMLMGVLVDVVSAIACTEKEGMTVIMLASSLRAAMEDMGRDPEETLTKSEFQELLVDKEIARICQSVDVDVVMMVDMVDVIFEAFEKDCKNMTFEDLIDTLLKMRGHNTATVKDIKAQLKWIKSLVLDSTASLLRQVTAEFAQLREEFQQQGAALQQELQARILSDSSDSEYEDDDPDLPGNVHVQSALADVGGEEGNP